MIHLGNYLTKPAAVPSITLLIKYNFSVIEDQNHDCILIFPDDSSGGV